AAALLVHVPGLPDSDYVNFPAVPRHSQIIPVNPGRIPVATRHFSDYAWWADLAETAVQDAIPTESYGNFGLVAPSRRSGRVRRPPHLATSVCRSNTRLSG